MNLVLFAEHQISNCRAQLNSRQIKHVDQTLHLKLGDSFRAGVRNGLVGDARILSMTSTTIEVEVTLDTQPPIRPNVDVILAMPRPKALKRILPALASMGVDSIFLVNSARVDKSYFQSKVIEFSFIDDLLVEGLEQSKDTIAPRVEVRNRFLPFIEDEAPKLFEHHFKILAHPNLQNTFVTPNDKKLVLAIGPDGGWVPFEVDHFARLNFLPFSLGVRTLRTEVAVSALMGALRKIC